MHVQERRPLLQGLRDRGRRVLLIGLVSLVMVVSLFAMVHPVLAHGDEGTRQLDAAPVGALALTVWSFPVTPRVGEVHLSAAVLRPTDGTPVVDCILTFLVSPLDQNGEIQAGSTMWVEAGAATAATGFMHEGVLTLDRAGRYHVDVHVMNPNGQLDGTAAFEITVEAASILFKWIVIGLAIFTLVVVVWFVREAQIVWAHRTLLRKTYS